jgi:hypothetical protein
MDEEDQEYSDDYIEEDANDYVDGFIQQENYDR